jgi:hypothetical protein
MHNVMRAVLHKMTATWALLVLGTDQGLRHGGNLKFNPRAVITKAKAQCNPGGHCTQLLPDGAICQCSKCRHCWSSTTHALTHLHKAAAFPY